MTREIIRVRRTGGKPQSWYMQIRACRDMTFDVYLSAHKYRLADTPHNLNQFKKFEEEFKEYRHKKGFAGPLSFPNAYNKWLKGYSMVLTCWEEAPPATNREAIKFLTKEE